MTRSFGRGRPATISKPGTAKAVCPRRGGQTVLLVLLAVAFVGCKDKPAESPEPSGGAAAKAGATSDVVVDLPGLQKVVAQHRGKVVYLDFWATWCVPCVKGLPHLAKLQERFGSRGFQAIPVSFDETRLWGTKCLQTLDGAGWRGLGVIAKDSEAQKKIRSWLGQKWRGELPARYLIDREGKIVHEILGSSAEDQQEVERMIDQVLGQAPSAG